jgi:hypothetical protein
MRPEGLGKLKKISNYLIAFSRGYKVSAESGKGMKNGEHKFISVSGTFCVIFNYAMRFRLIFYKDLMLHSNCAQLQ